MSKEYNLERRTTDFAKNALNMLKKINESALTRPLISQLTRSATSIGANYREADGVDSKKEFIH